MKTQEREGREGERDKGTGKRSWLTPAFENRLAAEVKRGERPALEEEYATPTES